ncbi:MAG: hypothetical protein GX167_01445 [Firmicutes bacterium]|jgi:hypothetical protein|nr:hypothetical protein [Bacillota bacterium]
MKLKWTLDQLYFYLVCFVMLVTVIVGIINLVQAGIDLFLPVPEPDYYARKEIISELYARSTLPAEIIEQELEAQQEFRQVQARKQNLATALSRLLRGAVQLLIAVPVYLYHWRRIPRLT